jgi:GH15 family glucan-1,4-alpha-glucosidase
MSAFVPIEHYALVGDGRTGALISRSGSVDWLCLPDFDSASMFARLLDPRGGCFALAPVDARRVERRYVPRTNVLETTYTTGEGVVRVTDAMTLTMRDTLSPERELARRVEGLAGEVVLEWGFEPRPEYATRTPRLDRRAGHIVCFAGKLACSLSRWGTADAATDAESAHGDFRIRAGETALLVLGVASGTPLVLPGRDEVERRLAATVEFWQRWSGSARYEGRWREEVIRSALALKLLVFAPSGAIVAAPTTSLPESPGGARNWDYRYSWVRDSAYALTALLRLGYDDEPDAFFWWLSHATALTHPELRVLYRLNGDLRVEERELDHLEGYRGSRPVRVGNAAQLQTQLDVYGAVFDAIWEHASRAGRIDAVGGRALANIADWVAANWQRPDAGIWESRGAARNHTQSKAMCAIALERAIRLSEAGFVPDRTERWRSAERAVRAYVDDECWDPERRSYVRDPETRELDASLLTLSLFDYVEPHDERLLATIDAVERELRAGPLVFRYRDDDGLGAEEAAFLPCSFWLAAAHAKSGRAAEAVRLVEELLALANDVGLWSEEAAPDDSLLGNFPQALTHLAFVGAALAIEDAEAA